MQAVAALMVGFLLVGAFVGLKVGKARTSHSYYRTVKASVPKLRKTAWTDIRDAAGVALLIAFLIAVVVYGISAQG